MSFIQAVLSIVGRTLLVGIFLLSAVGNKIPKFNEVVGYMEAEGVPEPRYALMGAIAFLILGSLSVFFGYKARFGAFLLAVFLCAATYYFHDFWKITDDATKQMEEMGQFMKNASLLGAMIFIIGNGSGAGSVDKRKVTITV